MNDNIQKAKHDIDDAVKCFQKRINQISENGSFRKARKMPTTFSMLKFANDDYYEYAYFERTLEWFVRDLLINSIMLALFNNHDIECLRPESKNYVRFTTEAIENIFPFEFIFVSGGEKFGVRYTGLCDEEVEELRKDYDVKRIIQIKWSDELTKLDKEQTLYEVVTPKSFFSKYLTLEEYDIFIFKVTSAIEEANAEIGFETIPRLSLRYLSNFKAEVKNVLKETPFEQMRFQELWDSNGENELNEKVLGNQDYIILNNNFKNRGLYKTLLGTEGFAKCFITAEYQYQVFRQGYNFDYTSVVCGYLKAVEQLIYKLLMINLSYPSPDKLWIRRKGGAKSNSKDIPDEAVWKSWIVFDKKYKDCFDITLGPMIQFFKNNVNGWEISKEGRLITCSFLQNFKNECRNEYFHKDNIEEFSIVSRIRNNAILIIYLLLGGYKLTGDNQKDFDLLGIIDDSFDRLYKRIQKLSSSVSKFLIYLPEKSPIKAYRHFSQEQTFYDANGSVASSKIRFVEVDKFGSDEWDKAMEGGYADREFSISQDNMPSRISYINGRKEEVPIIW